MLRTLGPLAKLGAEGWRPVPPGRAAQLIALLAATAHWVPRQRIAGLLWPDRAESAARRNLRRLIYDLGDAWPEIATRSDALHLAAASDANDLTRAFEAGDMSTVVSLYGGEFAEGLDAGANDSFAEWLRFERQRLAALFRRAGERRIADLRAGGDLAGAERIAWQWMALEPSEEAPLLALAGVLAMQGRRDEAHREAQRFAERMRATFGVEPTPAVRALLAPPPVAPAAGPAPAASGADAAGRIEELVGRRYELQVLAKLLAGAEPRLVTVTGPGGIGKSRLARAAVAACGARFSRRAWVATADLNDLAALPSRVLGALGTFGASGTSGAFGGSGSGNPGPDPMQSLIDELRAADALIVLDNVEHLDGLGAWLRKLLDAAPGVRVLATSRRTVAIDGEYLFPVHGLPAPDTDETDPQVLRRYDAVRLFELRAAAAWPEFDPLSQAGATGELVRRVDGMPLAIELAAAWVRSVGVADIVREVERSLDLLSATGGGAGTPVQPDPRVPHDSAADRHRSVRACFAHSWQLLSAIEQRALARLSLFQASFSRESAQRVALAPLPVLAALVDKSMLRAAGEGLFDMHPLVRQFAAEKLDEGDARGAGARYVNLAVATLTRRENILNQGAEPLGSLALSIEDCRRAWSMALHAAQCGALAEMAAPLATYHVMRGESLVGIEAMRRAIEQLAAPGEGRLAVRARAWHALLSLYFDIRNLAEARTAAQEALRAYKLLRRPAERRAVLMLFGRLHLEHGQPAQALSLYRQLLRAVLAAGDAPAAANATIRIGLCQRLLGLHDEAIATLLDARRKAAACNALPLEAVVLNNLGDLYRMQGDLDRAERSVRDSLAINEAIGRRNGQAASLIILASLAIDRDDGEQAARLLDRADDVDASAARGRSNVEVRLIRVQAHALRGEAGLAIGALRTAVESAVATGAEPLMLGCVHGMAELARRLGHGAAAVAGWRCVAGHAASEIADRVQARQRLQGLGEPAPAQGSDSRAALVLCRQVLVEAGELEAGLGSTALADGPRGLRQAQPERD